MSKPAIYIRTSTEEQSPETQLNDIYTIAPKDSEVITEKQSAWKDHLKVRPKFKALKERVVRGEVKTIYVWDFDRLYRNRIEAIGFMQMCNHYGCKVYSYRQKWFQEIDRTPAPWNEILRNFLFDVMAWVAEEESNKLSDRIKKSVRHKGGVTQSYKGKKWGRPGIDIDVNEVLAQRERGDSIRTIAQNLGVSHNKIQRVLKSSTDSFINKQGERAWNKST